MDILDIALASKIAGKGSGGGGMPDPSAFADGTALVSVDGAWVQQEGYGYESAGAFEPMTWDGTYDESELYFGSELKISDEHPTANELIGATVSYMLNGEIGSKVIDSSMLDDTFGLLQVIIRLDEQSPYIIQLMILDEEYEGAPAGTYVNITGAENIIHFSSLIAPPSVHQFDPKFIPNVAPPVEIGKFLALWDCSTGFPETDPVDGVPYTYTTGDFYIISVVDETTNYMPNGATYDGTASTTVDSGHTEINDMYFYDGALWRLLKNSEPSLSSEVWTFTLENGTTVTKNVVVSG